MFLYGAHNWTEPQKNVELAGFSCCPARDTVVHGGSLWIAVVHAGSTMDQPGPCWAAWISTILISMSSVNPSIPQDLPHDGHPRCSVWLHAMSTLTILSILFVSETLKVLGLLLTSFCDLLFHLSSLRCLCIYYSKSADMEKDKAS